MFKRAYIEITNRCNLHCAFCPGTKRTKRDMSPAEFRTIAQKLQGVVNYLYFHVMGEPLLHENIMEFLEIAHTLGFRVCLTTNGTLLRERGMPLLSHPSLHKVSISLHSMEGNGIPAEQGYLTDVWQFAQQAVQEGVIVALRLWNIGGLDTHNGEILAFLAQQLGTDPLTLPQPRAGSWRLGDRLYLEQAERFDWPDLSCEETGTRFCLGLREQLAVLCDGTLVPCCLDHEGDIALGNLLTDTLPDLLHTPRARALYDGFSRGKPSEALCRRCGYATRF